MNTDQLIPTGLYSPLSGANKQHVKLISEKINNFKKLSNLSWPKILDELEQFRDNQTPQRPDDSVMNYDYFRRFVSKPNSVAPNDEQLNLIYNYLDSHNAWNERTANRAFVSGIEDPIFFSMLEFLDVPELTTANLLNDLPGIFRVYRPTLTHPGKYICGAIRIWGDHKTGKIIYEEVNAIKKQEGREAKSIRFQGFAFRKKEFIFLLSAESSKSAIHLTMLSDNERQGDQYHAMSGGFIDTMGKQIYTGKIFIERVPELDNTHEVLESVLADLDCFDKSRLPKSIQMFFEDDKLVGGVRIY
ncbi:hypothetical protein WNZ15_25890 [Roseibium sp. AS2]|uniref:hypothetical protein n=1 Tax=Roseibium sp. AS2 TaxID=3135781 RepID=UPI00317E02D4